MSRYLCPACYGERPAQASCSECFGRGRIDYAFFAERPWDEIVPNLWVGGHDYAMGWSRTSTEMLDAEGFQVVVSLYETYHSRPSEGVDHYSLVIPDGALEEEEIEQVYEMSDIVAISVQEGRKTLVRCQAGLNRSALVAALAMIRMGHDPEGTIDLIRSKRSRYNLVNPTFVKMIKAHTLPLLETP